MHFFYFIFLYKKPLEVNKYDEYHVVSRSIVVNTGLTYLLVNLINRHIISQDIIFYDLVVE